MKRENILLVGAGGHALACIDVIEAEGRFKIQGLVGSSEEKQERRLGYSVLGDDSDIYALYGEDSSALVCIGQIKTPDLRMRLFYKLREIGYRLPAIIAPTAWVSPHACVGAGSIIMHGAIVNAGAEVGENCIVNSKALIEHGVKVGSHCHVSTGALINGGAKIGDGSFVGSGSQIREGVQVGRNCVIGLGVAVLSDLADELVLKRV